MGYRVMTDDEYREYRRAVAMALAALRDDPEGVAILWAESENPALTVQAMAFLSSNLLTRLWGSPEDVEIGIRNLLDELPPDRRRHERRP